MNPWHEERRGVITTFVVEGIDAIDRDPTADTSAAMGAATIVLVASGVAWLFVLFELRVILGILLGTVLLFGVAFLVRARPKPEVRTSRWTVRLEPGAMSVDGARRHIVVDLVEIERLEATDSTIELVRRSGERQALPFVLGTHEGDEALASRLTEAVVAARIGTGYRGYEPEDDGEAERARRRS